MRKIPTLLSVGLIFAALTASSAPAQMQTYRVLATFGGGASGAFPEAALTTDGAGNSYGTTLTGGAYQSGTIFKIDGTGTKTVLYRFTGGTDGGHPAGRLVLDAAGNLYGTTQTGGSRSCPQITYCGTVFELTTNGNLRVLHRFSGTNGTDGAYPNGDLVRGPGGNLYGTTSYGGIGYCSGNASGCGTVFKVDTAGNESVLYSFAGPPADGANPWGGLVQDPAGNLYGTLSFGGSTFTNGAVFKLDTTGKETVLYNFTGCPDGAFPYAGLILDAAGNLYGTTSQGGDTSCPWAGFGLGCGTVFKMDATGKETVLYTFTGGTDGAFPMAALVRDASGSLYGTANSAGAYNDGTVFKLDTTNTFTVLHAFAGQLDGANPDAGLLFDPGAGLLGTAATGGDPSCKLEPGFGCGVVFAVQP